MKKISIKMKVTLWYTGIVAVILGIVFAAGLIFVDKVGISATEEEIQGAVTGFISNIKFQDDTYYLDADTEFYDDGVMFCIYDQNGKLLYGTMPVSFPKETTLNSGAPRVVKSSQKQWMVYDCVYYYGGKKAIWVRGITSIHKMEIFVQTSKKAALIGFPMLILLIGVIGYFMIKRALRQVDHICREAEKISTGNDLTLRIELPRVRDEMYELSKKFNEMFERLEQSFEKERQFTADVSHELRTPVAVVISQCEYLLNDDNLLKDQREEIERILRQAQRMSRLVSEMLMMAREERNLDHFEKEEVDLGMLTEFVAQELQNQAEEKSIKIQLQAEDEVFVQGDQTLLMRFVINLIQNAIQYGKEGGHIWITLKKDGQWAVGEVRDDGIGIAREHLDKIWNRFYRVDKSRSRENGGTGLGLSMVSWIAKMHGGEIRVESVEGTGTNFIFRFPKK